jgi:tetratricopeptide (TPR) repeat protein
MSSLGENLLLQGQQLREQGKTFEALDCLNRALEVFVSEQDYSRFSHTLLDRAICWQHLYLFNNKDIAFAILYKKDSEAMMEIVQEKNLSNELTQAYFTNAKAYLMFKDYPKAIELFKKSIDGLKESQVAQKGDF